MNRNKIFTAANQAAAEIRLQFDAPLKARLLYYGTDPLYISEYWDGDIDEYRCAYTGCLGERIGLTWDEMMNDFVSMEREFEEGEEDE